jgi:hypothetical protein
MLRILLTGALLLATLPASAQQLTADAIMARVAANQDASETGPSHFIYLQHVHIASRKGKTVRCEELTDSRVTPVVTGSDHQLLKLDGRLLQKGKYTVYDRLPSSSTRPKPRPDDPKPSADPAPPNGSKPSTEADDDDININLGDDTMDRDLVENLRQNLTVSHSRDGIAANLFPLTSKEQAGYKFTLLGREPRNGRDSFHIAFAPKDTSDFTWRGDAWIDATAFQPIVIRTTMSRKIPLAVRMLLGTNVPGLGFTIVYAPQPTAPADKDKTQPEPIWFPTSFGTEFKIHVLFFFNREIVFNAENRDFQKTYVTSEIVDPPDTSK